MATVVSRQDPRQTYRYDTLPTDSSIRLVSLRHDVHRPDEICISMRTVDLAQGPQYHTLSYTWGNPRSIYRADEAIIPDAGTKQDCSVYCDDDKILLVTNNLYAFLKLWRDGTLDHLSSQTQVSGASTKYTAELPNLLAPPKELWIDAICINQQDLSERNSQVKLMASIYYASTTTWIWLGETDWCTERGMNYCYYLSGLSLESAEGLHDVQFTDPRWTALLKADKEDCLAIYALLNRAWFHRAWIVQEVIFGRNAWILCGYGLFSPGIIVTAAQFLIETRLDTQIATYAACEILGLQATYRLERSAFPHKPEESASGLVATSELPTSIGRHIYGRLYREMQRFDGKLPQSHFAHLLSEMRWTKATDPRDKVFSSLGIAQATCYWLKQKFKAKEPEVDYHKSCAAVYTEVSWYLLSVSDGLELLSSVQDRSLIQVEGLPSWVPDWSAKKVPNGLKDAVSFKTNNTGSEKVFAASGTLKWTPSHIGSAKLHVQGWRVDSIINVALLSEQAQGGIADTYKTYNVAPIAAALPRVYPWAWNRTKVSPNAKENLKARYIHPPSETLALRSCDMAVVDPNNAVEVPMAQSKVEALWRTMVADRCDEQRPAPLSVGFGFGDWLALQVWKAETLLELSNIRSSQSEQPALVRDSSKEEEFLACQEIHSQLLKSELNCRVHDSAQASDTDPDPLLAVSLSHREQARIEKQDFAYPVTGIGFVPADIHVNREKIGRERQFIRNLNRASSGRRLFQTAKDFLGNGPRSLEMRDEVWIVAGADVPMILRPFEDETYRLIGEAYVHGIMDGEALRFESFELSDIVLV